MARFVNLYMIFAITMEPKMNWRDGASNGNGLHPWRSRQVEEKIRQTPIG